MKAFMESVLKNRNIVFLVLVFLVGFAVYSNSFNNPFQFDDAQVIVGNTKIYNIERIGEFFRSVKLTDRPYFSGYRPLVMASFSLNYHFGGLDPWFWRVVNLILHGLNSVLAFFIISELLKSLVLQRSENEIFLLSALASLVFLLHPVNTVAINFIWKRSTLLYSFFVLAALLWFLKIHARFYEESDRKPFCSRLPSLIFLNVLFILGILSKEAACVLPGAIILCYVARGNFKRIYRFIGDLVPLFLIAFAYSVFRIFMLGDVLRAETSIIYNPLDKIPDMTHYLVSQINVITRYIGLIVYPHGLNIFHEVVIPQSIFDAKIFIQFLFLILLFLMGIVLYKRAKWFGFGVFWFFLFLIPTSATVPHMILMDEIRVYMPLLGFSLLLAGALALTWNFARTSLGYRKAQALGLAFLPMLLFFLGLNSYLRNFWYVNETVLWKDAVEKSPNSFIPRLYLGYSYMNEGKFEKAVREMKVAVNMRPQNSMARIYLGLVYQTMKRYEDSIREYGEVYKRHPFHYYANQNLGVVYLALENYEKALFYLKRACEVDNTAPIAFRELGWTYFKMKNAEKALVNLMRCLSLNPYDSLAAKRVGLVYLELLGNRREGLRYLEKSLELDPSQPRVKEKIKELKAQSMI